jgi:hypothetical protein
MPEIKTKVSEAGVAAFLDAVEPPQRREDGRTLCALLQDITGEEPRLWGPSIIGFGSYRYRHDGGQQGTMCRIGFSPRKAQLVLYLLNGAKDEAEQLARLGKHKLGKSCLYINKLVDVDLAVLAQIARSTWEESNKRYPPI